MATFHGVKLTFSIDQGAEPWWNTTVSNSDPTYDSNIATWKTAYLTFVNQHAFSGTENFRIRHERINDTTIATTYVVETDDVDNVEDLVMFRIRTESAIANMSSWRDTVYNPNRGIVLQTREQVSFEM